eukprot:4698875-Alexandrium_andersonii.AAC.1
MALLFCVTAAAPRGLLARAWEIHGSEPGGESTADVPVWQHRHGPGLLDLRGPGAGCRRASRTARRVRSFAP